MKGMKVVHEQPPEWIMKGCLDKFRVNDVEHTVWTYGDTIFAPGDDRMLPDHILAHESQHEAQQAAYEGGKDAWWREFLANPRFRLEQEAEAYGAQYRFYCERVKDRNRRALFLMQIAGQLSGPLYQIAVTPSQARGMILVLSGQMELA